MCFLPWGRGRGRKEEGRREEEEKKRQSQESHAAKQTNEGTPNLKQKRHEIERSTHLLGATLFLAVVLGSGTPLLVLSTTLVCVMVTIPPSEPVETCTVVLVLRLCVLVVVAVLAVLLVLEAVLVEDALLVEDAVDDEVPVVLDADVEVSVEVSDVEVVVSVELCAVVEEEAEVLVLVLVVSVLVLVLVVSSPVVVVLSVGAAELPVGLNQRLSTRVGCRDGPGTYRVESEAAGGVLSQ